MASTPQATRCPKNASTCSAVNRTIRVPSRCMIPIPTNAMGSANR